MINITMLGTGNALVTKCYNTCFLIQTDHGVVMVDAGGGNGIQNQMAAIGADWKQVNTLYITHGHTDHILGCIWVMRKINTMMKKGKYSGEFHVYGLKENLDYLKSSCEFMLADPINDNIKFISVADRDKFAECGIDFEVMDIFSTKMNQIGFRATIPSSLTDGKCDEDTVLVCLGDEPYNEKCESLVCGADWLMSEAFCLYEDREVQKPYEKHHSTALDAGVLADKLGVKNLILYHTEDTDLEHRSERYSAEARQHFKGNIYVPNDLENIALFP